jgi:hypothetical protein
MRGGRALFLTRQFLRCSLNSSLVSPVVHQSSVGIEKAWQSPWTKLDQETVCALQHAHLYSGSASRARARAVESARKGCKVAEERMMKVETSRGEGEPVLA